MTSHNSVLKILEKCILKYTYCKVATETESFYTDSLQRAFLEIEDTKNKTIFLIDEKCLMDVFENLEREHHMNTEKYTKLGENIEEILPKEKVVLDTSIVAGFGFLAANNDKILFNLKVIN